MNLAIPGFDFNIAAISVESTSRSESEFVCFELNCSTVEIAPRMQLAFEVVNNPIATRPGSALNFSRHSP